MRPKRTYSKRLTLAEEQALFAAGDVDHVVAQYVPYANSMAHRFGKGSATLTEELRSVAQLGLMEATRNFDPSRGFKFLTYATPVIRAEIFKYLRPGTAMVAIPRDAAPRRCWRTLVAEPTMSTADLARVSSVPLDIAEAVHAAFGGPTLDSAVCPLECDEPNPEQRMIKAEWDADLQTALRRALKTLTPKQREVIDLLFLNDKGLTPAEINAKRGTTGAASRALRDAAFAKLRPILRQVYRDRGQHEPRTSQVEARPERVLPDAC